MAGGKLSPRQKMINMMYLVLTALLAMNVSAEILNAFRTVNGSIMNSNAIIMDKNAKTYDNFQAAVEDPQTAEKAKQWKVFADNAKSISDAMYDRIEALKTQIKKDAGLKINEDGEEEFKIDDLDVAARLMVEGGEGPKLYDDINKFKAELLAVIDLAGFEGNPTMKKQIQADIDAFAKSMTIDLSVAKSTTGEIISQDGKGWAKSNFYMTPAIAAVTILSKLQNDVRSSQTQVIDYCYSQIGQVKVVYDQFAAIASANTNYAMPGDPIEIVAGVGAFSAAAQPTVTIAGKVVPLEGGQAIFKTNASGSGTQSIPVKISFTQPDGTVATVDKNIEYTVGTPSGAAVMFDKMNVLYIGVDNPLTISSGSGDEKTKVSINGGGGTLTKTSAGKYIAKVTSPTKEAVINVSVDGGKSLPFAVRVKYIPDPIPTLGGDEILTSNGKGQKGTIKAKGGIIPLLKDFDFDAKFTVISYDFYLTSGGELFPARANAGPAYSSTVTSLIDRAKPNDLIVFDNIQVKGPDGKNRKIPSMSFLIF